MKGRGRAVIYIMAGIYLLFMAYYMFRDRAASAGTEYIVVMVFMCLFVVLGIGLIGVGLWMMNKAHKERIEQAKAEPDETDVIEEISEEEEK